MARLRIEPSETQWAAIRRIESEPTGAALIASETGTGKTLIAVESLRDDEVNLIVCPLSTFDSWEETINAQRPDMVVRIIDKNDKNNETFELLKAGVAGTYIIGQEFFHIAATEVEKKDGLILRGRTPISHGRVKFQNRDGKSVGTVGSDANGNFTLRQTVESDLANIVPASMIDGEITAEQFTTPGRKRRWKWSNVKTVDVIVVDEVHSAKNRNSKMFKMLKTLKVNRLKLGMSATPGGDTFDGLWSICRWLWPDGNVVEGSHWVWQQRWMTFKFDAYTQSGKRFTHEKNEGEFVKTLPCYIREKADRVPVEPWWSVSMGMTDAQKEQYEAMKKDSVAWLNDNPLVADLPLVQKIRLRQMCLGEVSFADDGSITFADDCESTFIDGSIKITHRHEGEHILFLTISNSFAHVLVKRLNAHYGKEVAAAWTGSETTAERNVIKERFIAGELLYIVGTITKAIAVGTDGLQWVCNIEVWLGKSLESVMNEQGEGRLNRRGQFADHIERYELTVPGSAQEEDFERDARKFLQRVEELG